MAHKYKDPNTKFVKPGVTSIISDCVDKPGLRQWAPNVAIDYIRETTRPFPEICDIYSDKIYQVSDKILEEAKYHHKEKSKEALRVGSETHACIEATFLHDVEIDRMARTLAGQSANAFGAFLQFRDDYKLEPIRIEQVVYGDYWGSMIDFRGYVNSEPYILDWKTAAKLNHYPNEHGPQLAAYKSLFPDFYKTAIVLLSKETGEYDFKDYTKRYKKDLKHFKLMLNLYMHRHPRIAKAAGWEEN